MIPGSNPGAPASARAAAAAPPRVLLAPHFRTVAEIFDAASLERLHGFATVLWARDEPIPVEEVERQLPELWAYVGTSPPLGPERLARAPKLRAIVDVAGAFPATVDYAQCFARGIRVLGCAPAFGPMVAEMALTMMLAGARGLVAEHEAMRAATETWQHDRTDFDVTLYDQDVGFVGAGGLARSLLPLLAPFRCRVRAYDPWLPASQIRDMGCEPCDLDTVLAKSRIVVVLAAPSSENRALLGRRELELIPPGGLVVLISRSHLVDFDALTELAAAGRLQAAIDVFPEEPLPPDHPVRAAPNVILSAHRAASIRRERTAIGRMVVDDLELMARGLPPVRLQAAQPEVIARRLGQADAPPPR